MAIAQPGIPNGGFPVAPPPVGRAVAPPPAGSAPPPVASGFNYGAGAPYATYSNYAPVGSAAWDQAYGLDPAGVNASIASSPWNSGQLAQAAGIDMGLADFMFSHDPGLGGQQFMQAAGFTNAPGSQMMLNDAGRQWIFANDQTYGGAGPGHLGYGFTANGTPYSYDRGQIGGNDLRQWAMQGGATPNGVTLYSQFAPSATSAMGQYVAGNQAPGGAPVATPPAAPAGNAGIGTGVGAAIGGASGGAANPVTLGSLAGGTAPVPGAGMNVTPYAGNPYSLNIGNYLNPLMQYAMQQGTQSIMNSQAASGLLNSGDTLKQLYGYGLGLGAGNFNSAAQIAAGQQGFGAGLDQYDQQFAYNAQNADRNFALSSLLGMGQLGLGGASQQGANDRILASLISGNLGALGQAQGAGAVGGSNAINNAITQALAQYMQGNFLSGLGLGGG